MKQWKQKSSKIQGHKQLQKKPISLCRLPSKDNVHAAEEDLANQGGICLNVASGKKRGSWDHHEVLLCQLAFCLVTSCLSQATKKGRAKWATGNFETLASTGKCSRSKGGLANLSAAKLENHLNATHFALIWEDTKLSTKVCREIAKSRLFQN